ncbi:carboxylesterase 1C, partial [Eurytemora carolleeae]|uniref:carboxylesterase 1C n=1 Tax=Eurytemora carolleeae TaxID=1294199 RepID=UPI000C765F93
MKFLLVVFWFGLVGTEEDTFPRTQVISTRKGKVQGRTISLVGGEYKLDPVDVYLGIPYALPPTGLWRFSPTQDLPPWPGILQATSPGPSCPQRFPRTENQTEAEHYFTAGYIEYINNVRSSSLSMSEDCLYLSIFSPTIQGNNRSIFSPTIQ